MQRKRAHFRLNDWDRLTVIGSDWGGRMGERVQFQALQEPETAAQHKGRTGSPAAATAKPCPDSPSESKGSGCVYSRSAKVRCLLWGGRGSSPTNGRIGGALALCQGGALASHLNPGFGGTPGAAARAVAWAAGLYCSARVRRLLPSGDAKWRGYSGALPTAGLSAEGRKTGGF